MVAEKGKGMENRAALSCAGLMGHHYAITEGQNLIGEADGKRDALSIAKHKDAAIVWVRDHSKTWMRACLACGRSPRYCTCNEDSHD